MTLPTIHFISKNSDLRFPHPFLADEDGLLAIGGDLCPDRIILAYRFGIFPWYSEEQPVLWWAPQERFVLDPTRIHVAKSMRRYINNPIFKFTTDQNFEYVIDKCQNIHRPGQDGTWITPELKAAYIHLHKKGIAHSVEIWKNDQIVGGLYGLGVGHIFSGESMFSEASDASKYAVIVLGHILRLKGYKLIDAQLHSTHMERLGGFSLSNHQYFDHLRSNLQIAIDTELWPFENPTWFPL